MKQEMNMVMNKVIDSAYEQLLEPMRLWIRLVINSPMH